MLPPVSVMCRLLVPEKDLNHSHIIIKLDVNFVPPYVITRGFSSSIVSHSVQDYTGECSMETGSSSTLFLLAKFLFTHLSTSESYQLIQ